MMEKKQNYPALTGLKGLVVFVIVLGHTLELTPLVQTIPFITLLKLHAGRFGNYMFFMTSGFLMAYHYKSRIQEKTVAFDDFLLKRLRKLYPLYLISNLVMLGINALRDGMSVLNLHELLMVVLLQAGVGLSDAFPYNYPTWFIGGLLLCQVLFFLIACHSKNRTQYRCILVGMTVLGYILVKEVWDFYFLYTKDGMALISFFPGCLLAEVWETIHDKKNTRLQILCLGVLGLVAFQVLRFGIQIATSDIDTLIAFLICPEILLLALTCKPVSGFLRWRGIQFLGSISMHVFFWHTVVFDVFMTEIYQLGILPEIYELRYVLYLAVLVLFSCLSRYVTSAAGRRAAKTA